jgi:hypothetical protein
MHARTCSLDCNDCSFIKSSYFFINNRLESINVIKVFDALSSVVIHSALGALIFGSNQTDTVNQCSTELSCADYWRVVCARIEGTSDLRQV